ncbi:Hypothetical protein POVR2_LOCUS165 [uncultured virus]|nr:Hypothetical protein POVR2_LOCUS165 [uncultured virus]
MESINNAKMLALGNHECVENYIAFNPDGSINLAASFSYPTVVNSKYIASTGSVHSDYIVGGVSYPIDEYCNGIGGICIKTQNTSNSQLYGESIDGNDGNIGTAWRVIPWYSRDAKKDLRELQWLIPTVFKDTNKKGDILAVAHLDDNNKLGYIVTQTCTVVDH